MREQRGSEASALVVAHVRGLLDRGALRGGDRLPAERELARVLGVSRPSLRAGLRSLAEMGIVLIRPGAGSFIAGGPPAFGTDALRFQRRSTDSPATRCSRPASCSRSPWPGSRPAMRHRRT
jgi:DNA-binding FadR family transcriptional regulator